MRRRVRLKRAYEPAARDDGARVLVDRVWPRGVSKQRARLTAWMPEIAPTTALRKWFGHEPERWPQFRRRYHAELRANRGALAELRALMKDGPVTLVYGARDEEHNQAVALAEFLRAR